MSKPNVGVVGLGSMGGGVARSLLRADFPVRVCDVRPAVVQSFVDSGAIGCATPAELGAACDVVIVLVVNAEQVDAVLFGENGAAPAMRQGSVLVMSVTVAPDYAVRLAARLAERGILMIDGPVSGGAAKAATGEMTVMGSGPPEAFAKCEAVFGAIAQKVYRLGDAPGTGSKVKMVNQLLAGVHIAAAAEAMALGIKAGADPACALRCHFQQRRRLLDVPEPRAPHPRRRLHAPLGGRHLRQGSGHRARGRKNRTIPLAAHGRRAPDVHDGRGGGARPRGRLPP